MQYQVTSPQSKVEQTIETDSPDRAAVRYVYSVWGRSSERRIVHVHLGTTMIDYDLILHPLGVVG